MHRKSRPYHHGDLKATMIQVALELVREKGPRGFTLNEASRKAGVSVSAPYNHFRDKEALLIEIVLLGNRTLESELKAAADKFGTAAERLLNVYLAYIDFAKHHPDLFAVMFQSGLDKDTYPAVQASAQKPFQVAADLANRIEPSLPAATQLTVAIWTMAHGFATLSAENAINRVITVPSTALAEHLGRRLLSL